MRSLPFCALLAVATLAVACGPDRRDDRDDDTTTDTTPDAGDVTPAPDAGTVTSPPDAGHVTDHPDAGTTPPTNHPPSASLVTPAGAQRGDIPLNYVLFDADRDLLSVTVQWSADGATWHPATTASATTSLQGSPDGIEQLFVWSSASDLPNQSATVRIRLDVSDGLAAGAPAFTANFALDNTARNQAPVGTVEAFTSPVVGELHVVLDHRDPDSDTLHVTVEYSVDNAPYAPATLRSANPFDTASQPFDAPAHLYWNTAADVPRRSTNVLLRVTLDDGQHRVLAGGFQGPFTVDTPPPATTTTGVRITRLNGGAPDWFELRNNGSTAQVLSGWLVRYGDSEGTVTTLTIPSTGNPTLFPGARVIVSEESGTTGGGTVYLSSSTTSQNISWFPGLAGSLEILDASGNTQDFVRWGGSRVAPAAGAFAEPKLLYLPQDGASLVRPSPTTDTDSANDFCAAPSPRTGSTGACLASAPAGTKVRFTEWSFGAGLPPLSTGAPTRWVELLNDGAAPVNLADWAILGLDNVGAGQLVLPATTIPAGGRLLVREGSGAENTTGGVHTVFANAGTFTGTAGTPGVFVLVDPAGAPQDFVAFGLADVAPPAPLTWPTSPRVSPPSSTGTSGRSTDASTTVAPAAWCAMNAPTPGAANSACRPPLVSTGLRINEVGTGKFNFLVNSVNGYIELRNTSAQARPLAGYVLRWTGSGTWSGPGSIVFADNTVTNLAPGARLTISECGPTGTVGQGCDVQSFPWGQLQSNGGAVGSVELVDPDGRSVDFMRWGGSTDQPSTGGAWTDSPAPIGAIPSSGTGPLALGRGDNAADTDRAADWCVQVETPNGQNTACN